MVQQTQARVPGPAPRTRDAVPHGQAPDPTLHLPRILCLHGGGTNARIFRAQCRVLRARLASSFRLVFADAPFPSRPGPDVESVYAAWGPFRSWLPPAPGGGEGPAAFVDDIDTAAAQHIDRCLEAAMREDDKAGATGRWVGLLGFSQGARMAASLLWRRQQQGQKLVQRRRSQGREWDGWAAETSRDGFADGWVGQTTTAMMTDLRFAVLLAGRGPLVAVGPDMKLEVPGLLWLPTIHVHGLRDPGLAMHRELLYRCCGSGSTRLVEWDGDHRVPIRTGDVEAVVSEILHVAQATGVAARAEAARS
jgi:predicted esterase